MKLCRIFDRFKKKKHYPQIKRICWDLLTLIKSYDRARYIIPQVQYILVGFFLNLGWVYHDYYNKWQMVLFWEFFSVHNFAGGSAVMANEQVATINFSYHTNIRWKVNESNLNWVNFWLYIVLIPRNLLWQ